MQTRLAIAYIALTGLVLTACTPGPNSLGGHAITFDNDSVLLHAPGHSAARIDDAGNLSIDSHRIALTASEQGLLHTYYEQAVAFAAARSGTNLRITSQEISAAFGKRQSPADGNVTLAGIKQACNAVALLNATHVRAVSAIHALAPYASANTGFHCMAALPGMSSTAPPRKSS